MHRAVQSTGSAVPALTHAQHATAAPTAVTALPQLRWHLPRSRHPALEQRSRPSNPRQLLRPSVTCSASSKNDSSGSNGASEPVLSTRRLRDEAQQQQPPATLKQEAAASNREVSDKLINVFRAKKPAEWRKLIAYSRQWPMLAQGVLDRIEERAVMAEAAADEQEQLALRKLDRQLATVHAELSAYQQLIDKFRAAPSSDWEGMVSLNRKSMGQEFFKYLDLRIRAVHEDAKEQEALVALAAQLAALAEAFDRVMADQQAMDAASENFSSLLQVDSLEEADKKIDALAASGKLDPALLLMMAKAYAGAKETDKTREEVKDIMAHLYFKAKESFAQQAPKEVRILKYLLTVESERDRAELLAQAFQPGAELEAGEVDYLCTTPTDLLNTIENVLMLYDTSRSRGTLAGEAASLMNPEVIDRLRALQKQIRQQYT